MGRPAAGLRPASRPPALGVPDGLDHVAMLREPPRRPAGAAPAFPRAASGAAPAAADHRNIWWKRKPGPLGVKRYHERVRRLPGPSRIRFRAGAPGQQVGQLAVEPGSSRQVRRSKVLDIGGAGGRASRRAGTPQQRGWCRRNSATNRSGSGVIRQGQRRQPAGPAAHPSAPPGAGSAVPALRQRDTRGGREPRLSPPR